MLQIGRCVAELCRFYGRTAIFQLNNYNFSLSIFLPSLISYGKIEPITTFNGKVSRTVKLYHLPLILITQIQLYQMFSTEKPYLFPKIYWLWNKCIDQVILWIQKMD